MVERIWRSGVGVAVLVLATSCSLTVRKVGKPVVDYRHRQVTQGFQVLGPTGKPLTDLEVGDTILRSKQVRSPADARRVSTYESRLRLLPDPQNYSFINFLLIDFSGSVRPNAPAIRDAAEKYVRTLAASKRGVFRFIVGAFSGADRVYLATDTVAESEADIAAIVEAIARATDCENPSGYMESVCVDQSTNLHGAVEQSLNHLREQLPERGLSGAAFVAFTDGTDRAGRATSSAGAMKTAIEAAKAPDVALYAVALGAEVDNSVLSDIGTDGVYRAENAAQLADRFGDVAKAVRAEAESYYSLEFCYSERDFEVASELEIGRGFALGYLNYQFWAGDGGETRYVGCALPAQQADLAPYSNRRWAISLLPTVSFASSPTFGGAFGISLGGRWGIFELRTGPTLRLDGSGSRIVYFRFDYDLTGSIVIATRLAIGVGPTLRVSPTPGALAFGLGIPVELRLGEERQIGLGARLFVPLALSSRLSGRTSGSRQASRSTSDPRTGLGAVVSATPRVSGDC